MSREERKKATIEYYHKLYASKEALKVSFCKFYADGLLLKQKCQDFHGEGKSQGRDFVKVRKVRQFHT